MELDVVRKRLRVKGRVEEFYREDKCLRLLNRLKHPNIIPLLGSYTYQEEHTFLFPFFSLNLDEFLSRTERPGDFGWNFTFCSALTGLASALSKMHRLHLNEKEHDVDFEAIGYHHDLRPPNVLVSNDTFILADFGLGSLKDIAAQSHTPYKIISGDYIAPECTDMDENPLTVNRGIDVWAFGCLILEVLTYMLKGSDGVQEFRKKRLTKGRLQQFKDSGFYQPDGELKREVADWVEGLKSSNPNGDLVHPDLVHPLLRLSLDALRPHPRNRPNMDELNQRLADLSLQEHFDSVQHMFRDVLGAGNLSQSLKYHLECLEFAQERFQTWGSVLGLDQRSVVNYDRDSLEISVTIMRRLFHVLREDRDKRASGDLFVLRPCQQQTDQCVKELWGLIPDSLRGFAENLLTKVISAGSSLVERKMSLSGTGNEAIPHVSLVTRTNSLLSEFEKATQSFKDKLPDSISLDEVMEANTVDKVYDITDKLQADQELRNLSKIQPYLERLCSYSGVIGDLIGGNHDFSAFLWGPLGLLLLWSSKDEKAYRSIIDATAEIGNALPDFKESEAELSKNAESKEILVLFFKDILDFYLKILQPFSLSGNRPLFLTSQDWTLIMTTGWMYIFDHSWPKHSALVSQVANHLGRLTRLMRTEIRLEHIQQEHEFRKNALEGFEKQARETRRQEFYRVKTSLNYCGYDEALYRLRGVRSPGTGSWLFSNEAYTSWLISDSRGSPRTLWLVGIPGSGEPQYMCCCFFLDFELELQTERIVAREGFLS